jgi:hypothetical protein
MCDVGLEKTIESASIPATRREQKIRGTEAEALV